MGIQFREIQPYLPKVDQGAWVEIGADRGEGSTGWLIEQWKQYGTDKFYCIDMNKETLDKNITKHAQDGVEFILGQGEIILQQNPIKNVAVAYLDNFDWDYWLEGTEEGFVAPIRETYKKYMDCEMTNLNSQICHMAQAIHLIANMMENSLIVCDDTWFEPKEGIFIGKCSAVIPLLMCHRYSIIKNIGYRNGSGGSGVIMGRGNLLNEN